MQAWAILEEKLGHLSEARKLFDAATAADIRHAAAWHGWAVLELRQGNTRKARELLSKGLKYCGGNEYLYQTSALIEYRAGKVELARALFSQAIYYNPNSCASWLVRICLTPITAKAKPRNTPEFFLYPPKCILVFVVPAKP